MMRHAESPVPPDVVRFKDAFITPIPSHGVAADLSPPVADGTERNPGSLSLGFYKKFCTFTMALRQVLAPMQLRKSYYGAPLGLCRWGRATQGSLRSRLGYDMPPLRGYTSGRFDGHKPYSR